MKNELYNFILSLPPTNKRLAEVDDEDINWYEYAYEQERYSLYLLVPEGFREIKGGQDIFRLIRDYESFEVFGDSPVTPHIPVIINMTLKQGLSCSINIEVETYAQITESAAEAEEFIRTIRNSYPVY